MEANTAILVVKSIKRDFEQWTVTYQVCEEQLAYKCAKESNKSPTKTAKKFDIIYIEDYLFSSNNSGKSSSRSNPTELPYIYLLYLVMLPNVAKKQ